MSTGKIKVGSVSLPIYEVAQGWRVSYYSPNGKRQHITSKDKSKVIEKARKIARELHNQTVDLGSLEPDQVSILKRILSLGITHSDIDEWEKAKNCAKMTVSSAIDLFLTAKKGAKGASNRNYAELSSTLQRLDNDLGAMIIQDIKVTDLETWINARSNAGAGKRRVKNLRATLVTFFRWCRMREILPNTTTEAQKLEPIKITPKVPATWESADMRVILKACQRIAPEYIPWLILTSFNGLRSEELIPDGRSEKPPLDWSDFKWDRGIIIVRAETAKTKERRVIPIHDVTRAWLEPMRQDRSSVCPQIQPSSKRVDGEWLTKSLGDHVGGWKVNANRHSFVSYRAAQVGLAKTAMEAGNSESEARKSYNDAKSEAEAEEWFSLLPDKF